MNPCTNALYVSLMSRCDSAAIVPNTSELFPDPETPVKTVSRRFGISMLTSLRLFTRAPCTRMTSWRSAACLTGSVTVMAGRSDVNALVAQRCSWMRRRLPAGSRTAQSRTPYGCSVGSWTISASLAWSRSKVPSRSAVARRSIA